VFGLVNLLRSCEGFFQTIDLKVFTDIPVQWVLDIGNQIEQRITPMLKVETANHGTEIDVYLPLLFRSEL
jgi:hypothetical protein